MITTSSCWQNSSVTRDVLHLEKSNIFGFRMEVILLVFVLFFYLLLVIYMIQSKVQCNNNLSIAKSTLFPQVNWFNKISLPIPINGWYTMTQLGSVGIRVLEDCTKIYGKTFMLPLGPLNVIATSDIRIIQKLLSSNDPGHLNKSGYIYKRIFVEAAHKALIVSPSKTWLSQRKCLSPGFTYSAITSYLPIINKFAKDLTQDIITFNVEHGMPLYDGDVFAKFLSTRLLRFMGDLTTGFGSYTDAQIAQIQEGSMTNKEGVLFMCRHPLLFLRPIISRHPIGKISAQATEKLVKALREMVDSYKSTFQSNDLSIESTKKDKGITKHTPLVEFMLNQNWTEEAILANFTTLVFAENDPTFNGIQFTLLQLALNPHHQETCREEIDTIFFSKSVKSTGNFLDEIDICLNIADLSELKYLERCILESLRLLPPIPFFARRLSTKLKIDDDLEINPGKTVLVMPSVLHKDPVLYPNPNKFDPDRFLPENARKRPLYAYLPFSAGRRNCLGWKLSLFQLKAALAWLLRHFEVSTEERVDDIKMFYAVRTVPEKNFDIMFTHRKLKN